MTAQAWEYRIVRIDVYYYGDIDIDKLSQLGADGWRVVTVVHRDVDENYVYVLVERAVPQNKPQRRVRT